MINRTNGNTLDTIEYTKTRTVSIHPELLKDNRIIMSQYNDPRADIFRVLRTHVLKQLRGNGWNSFFVTSATPGAGKTFVSINLAIAIALEGNQTVLLVEADFRRPNVGKYLGLQPEYGLIDYLAGVAPLDKILINPGIEGLVILPAKTSNINYADLIASPKMANLAHELKSKYESRIIIFDIPPLFVADDALSFIPYVDGAVLVVEDGKNTTEELQHSMSILEQTNLFGLVLNKSRQPLPSYQYGYVQETAND